MNQNYNKNKIYYPIDTNLVNANAPMINYRVENSELLSNNNKNHTEDIQIPNQKFYSNYNQMPDLNMHQAHHTAYNPIKHPVDKHGQQNIYMKSSNPSYNPNYLFPYNKMNPMSYMKPQVLTNIQYNYPKYVKEQTPTSLQGQYYSQNNYQPQFFDHKQKLYVDNSPQTQQTKNLSSSLNERSQYISQSLKHHSKDHYNEIQQNSINNGLEDSSYSSFQQNFSSQSNTNDNSSSSILNENTSLKTLTTSIKDFPSTEIFDKVSKSSSSKNVISEDQLKTLFDDVDADKTGKIYHQELSILLSRLEFNFFSNSVINSMIKFFGDFPGYGFKPFLNFDKFTILWKYLHVYKNFFIQSTSKDKNALTFGEFQHVLTKIGYKLNLDLTLYLFQRFTHKNKKEMEDNSIPSEKIGFGEYIEVLLILRKLTNVFKNYDKDFLGVATIKFHDFIFDLIDIVDTK